jgi:hypothetical protein
MSPKNLISVDFREIASVEIKCSDCGGMITLPVEKENVPASQSCPGCNKPLWATTDSAVFNNLRDLAFGLSHWQQREEKRFTIGFSLPTS